MRFIPSLFAAVLAAAVPVTVPGAIARAADGPLVAAASDLQFALEEAATAFTAQTRKRVRLVFGSSGNFARQLRQGAPIELFLSADEGYVLGLARENLTPDEGELYAVGRIVLIVPHGSPLQPDGSLEDLKEALAQGRVARFSIANPEHAPYGKRAEEALRHKGIWEAIRPRLVLGENVSQAAQFATSGAAQGGIVAHSIALSPKLAALAQSALVPAEWHAPLRQRMVLTKNASEEAAAFYAFLQSPPARAILRKYGFELPQE